MTESDGMAEEDARRGAAIPWEAGSPATAVETFLVCVWEGRLDFAATWLGPELATLDLSSLDLAFLRTGWGFLATPDVLGPDTEKVRLVRTGSDDDDEVFMREDASVKYFDFIVRQLPDSRWSIIGIGS
jgi:hypothetical protein